MTVKQKHTRFRAYQLDCAGSSFSYFSESHFALIEARYTDANKDIIHQELMHCDLSEIDQLHITSWDQDHCVPSQLEKILEDLNPRKIEYPGYAPHTESGEESLRIICFYKNQKQNTKKFVQITPEYISSLDKAQNFGYNDIIYHPKFIDDDSSNNNSTIKHFRSGSFNVLSLGDVESTQIASAIRSYPTAKNEVDILILAHHGADNGFTTSAFLKKVNPTVAIASADYANQYDHPRQEVRDLLYKNDIQLFTTKTGDVVLFSLENHVGHYRLVNLKAGSTEISSKYDFYAKKSEYLNQNADTIRARLQKRNYGPKR